MAHRHLMAVCVVCLLCAEHLPCKEHILNPSKNINSFSAQIETLKLANDHEVFTTKAENIPTNVYLYDKRKDKTKDDVAVALRQKRHVHHESHEAHHHTETPEVTKAYIKKLFVRFSKNTETMGVDEFEEMMMQLDLKNLLAGGNATCMNSTDFLGKMTNQPEQHADEAEPHHDHDHGHDHDHDERKEEDHQHKHLTFRDKIKIESEHMLAMCPILLYHIVNRQSPFESDGCLNSSNFIATELATEQNENMEPKSIVWLYSTLSIIGVSLCGLLGVAVIPIMEKHFYHHVLQFLVALAVGTLAGDALLHLLPHAMMPIHEDQDLHHTMMMRGLAAVGGIVFFYFFERFLTMATEWRQKKQKRDKPSSRVRVMRDPESVSLNNGTSTATCKHKYSSYPYCYDEIAMETKDDHHEHQHVENGLLNNHAEKLKAQEDHLHILSPTDCKKINGSIDHAIDLDNRTLSTSLDDGSIESNALCNNNKFSGAAVATTTKKDSIQEENYTIILR